MTAIALLCIGVVLGAVAGYLAGKAAPRAVMPPVIGSAPEPSGLVQLNSLPRRVEELAKMQRQAIDRFDECFGHLARELHQTTIRIGALSREAVPREVPEVAPAAWAAPPRSSGAPVPDPVGEPRRDEPPRVSFTVPAPRDAPAFSMSSVMARWNALDWTAGSPEVASGFADELYADWRISAAIKHRFFLLYRATPEPGAGPMYLLPFLGKNIALLTGEFFDGPMAGAAERLVEAAEVQFREHHTTVEQELAKLMHGSYSTAEVLAVSKRGQIA